MTRNLLCLLSLAAAALTLSGCVSFLGNAVASPGFTANFRDGSGFPHAQPSDDVLILDIDNNLVTPRPVQLSIDDVLVQTVNLAGGRHELDFPPATWTPVAGGHVLTVEMEERVADLPFSWSN